MYVLLYAALRIVGDTLQEGAFGLSRFGETGSDMIQGFLCLRTVGPKSV